MLFDNVAAGVEISRAAAQPNWAGSIDLDLSRAIVADDDGKDLIIYFQFTYVGNNGNTMTSSWRTNMPAKRFREMASYNNTQATRAFPAHFHIFVNNAGDANSDDLGGGRSPRPWLICPQTDSVLNTDIMRIQATGSSSTPAWTDIEIVVFLRY